MSSARCWRLFWRCRPGASRRRRAAATGPPSAPAAPTGPRSTPSRRPFPAGIFPSDIGCYTLGLNLGAVDTCHCMGAGISQAAGFYRAYAAGGGEFPTIVATIGDSTFFHAGVPALINAVFHQARFILVILDNATTAMTGHQPTPQVGLTATGEPGHPVFIPDLVRASGAGFIREADPYDLPAFMDLLKEADAYCRSPAGGVAVIIAKHPCLLDREARKSQAAYVMALPKIAPAAATAWRTSSARPCPWMKPTAGWSSTGLAASAAGCASTSAPKGPSPP